MIVNDRPLFTDVYTHVDEFRPEPGSTYLFSVSGEERSAHHREWEAKAHDVNFVRVLDQKPSLLRVEINGKEIDLPLRNLLVLKDFINKLGVGPIYIDITGLSHHIWAPLLKVILNNCQQALVVYVEPGIYRFSATPKEGEIFDLSERITGISPIPGFISLREPLEEENVCFIPLLGFEGTRFSYLLEQAQPPGDKILPVIGVPGFQPEYPFYTYHGNQLPLLRTHSFRNVRFAIANCPFSLFYTLEDIARDFPEHLLKIAPIGTKPHALGSVLYAIANHEHVELIYDHPIRKPTRTSGASRLLVYHVSAFISSEK